VRSAAELAACNASGYNGRMFRHRLLSRPLLALSLAAVLLLAQWLLAQHGANLEQHAANHACEWCLTHAPLQAGVPAAATPPPVVAGASILPVVVLVVPASIAQPVYSSRAPPFLVSV
jgi:hypothetical protein